MAFFNDKLEGYLNTMSAVEQIEFLQPYADDAGSDGNWGDYHAITKRITQIRDNNPDAAVQYDANVIAKRDAAKAAKAERCKDGFIARGLD